jgi:TetR/AcrR family tetracycline transcriptional repressor
MALRREDVVKTALDLLDQVGLDGLTIRRLAQELGIQNPALYWHFKNKQDLLDSVAAAMITEVSVAAEPIATTASWEEWLVYGARQFRAAALSHRDGARILASANLGQDVVHANLDTALRVLRQAGFDSAQALNGMLAVSAFALGAALDAQSDPFPQRHDVTPSGFVAFRAYIDAARFPTLVATLDDVARAEPDRDRDTEFEAGLKVILEGMRAQRAQIEGRSPR